MAAVAISNGINGNDDKTLNGAMTLENGVVKEEDSSSEDEVPWAERVSHEASQEKEEVVKRPVKRELSPKSESPEPKKRRGKKKSYAESDNESEYQESDEDVKPKKKAKKKEVKKEAKTSKKSKKVEVVDAHVEKKKRKVKDEPSSATPSPKKKKKQEEEEEVWKWWEEEKKPDGIKWNSLEHKGPLFAPAYDPLPKHVKFRYNGKEMKLSQDAEEVATFYARMLDHEYTAKKVFNDNFFKDWRKTMTSEEKEKITDLTKCDFKEIQAYFLEESEKRRNLSKEEKLKIKEEKEAETKVYGFAFIDGHKQKIGNFRIEPPGLFRGRGDHPKMGRLKKRITPRDVIINCSKGSAIPDPPPGTKWKEVRHDNTVTWLCSWTENVLGNNKYIMLNPSSKIKGEKDFEKFETARKLKKLVGEIRKQYTEDFKNREMRIRQRAVALYFIDKLALRAGNEKDTDEAADTVGCCSLRCEHVTLNEELDGKKYVVEFDFLGKDSIRYYNKVPVEKQVFKNLKIFKEDKEPGDDLFDRLDTATLNTHLRSLMPGLTAKVFRTYNASITLQNQLNELTDPKASVNEKMLSYNRANRMVAVLCNHQRAVPKTHEKSMENLENKIKDKKKELKEAKAALDGARGKEKEKAEKKVDRIKEQLKRMKIQRTDKDENKQIALGTSKLNYLDPRISVAWCKKYDVPVEKVFNKTQREKFRWAIDMATPDYEF
ncbi:unnamed protein product [Bursaphelenchus okinawaensis]|uniref:DNA topoisomerase I n=1 Tax=Bursaphelenchus okinawaensis TaxID=465554 RepID=A0A811JPR6_9BILA|nr:unnamed protein product [Bursaphelenchus okinawaensis]CAG9076913.1 unnamed protein product [Bursaphelenchus okinawaensis]